jgi:hypothetical protein
MNVKSHINNIIENNIKLHEELEKLESEKKTEIQKVKNSIQNFKDEIQKNKNNLEKLKLNKNIQTEKARSEKFSIEEKLCKTGSQILIIENDIKILKSQISKGGPLAKLEHEISFHEKRIKLLENQSNFLKLQRSKSNENLQMLKSEFYKSHKDINTNKTLIENCNNLLSDISKIKETDGKFKLYNFAIVNKDKLISMILEKFDIPDRIKFIKESSKLILNSDFLKQNTALVKMFASEVGHTAKEIELIISILIRVLICNHNIDSRTSFINNNNDKIIREDSEEESKLAKRIKIIEERIGSHQRIKLSVVRSKVDLMKQSGVGNTEIEKLNNLETELKNLKTAEKKLNELRTKTSAEILLVEKEISTYKEANQFIRTQLQELMLKVKEISDNFDTKINELKQNINKNNLNLKELVSKNSDIEIENSVLTNQIFNASSQSNFWNSNPKGVKKCVNKGSVNALKDHNQTYGFEMRNNEPVNLQDLQEYEDDGFSNFKRSKYRKDKKDFTQGLKDSDYTRATNLSGIRENCEISNSNNNKNQKKTKYMEEEDEYLGEDLMCRFNKQRMFSFGDIENDENSQNDLNSSSKYFNSASVSKYRTKEQAKVSHAEINDQKFKEYILNDVIPDKVILVFDKTRSNYNSSIKDDLLSTMKSDNLKNKQDKKVRNYIPKREIKYDSIVNNDKHYNCEYDEFDTKKENDNNNNNNSYKEYKSSIATNKESSFIPLSMKYGNRSFINNNKPQIQSDTLKSNRSEHDKSQAIENLKNTSYLKNSNISNEVDKGEFSNTKSSKSHMCDTNKRNPNYTSSQCSLNDKDSKIKEFILSEKLYPLTQGAKVYRRNIILRRQFEEFPVILKNKIQCPEEFGFEPSFCYFDKNFNKLIFNSTFNPTNTQSITEFFTTSFKKVAVPMITKNLIFLIQIQKKIKLMSLSDSQITNYMKTKGSEKYKKLYSMQIDQNLFDQDYRENLLKSDYFILYIYLREEETRIEIIFSDYEEYKHWINGIEEVRSRNFENNKVEIIRRKIN